VTLVDRRNSHLSEPLVYQVATDSLSPNGHPGKVCSRRRSSRCQSKVVIERGAHPNERFAVINEQPDVELDAGQFGDWQPIDALLSAAQATAIASMRGTAPRPE
jgi:hypothetical protein